MPKNRYFIFDIFFLLDLISIDIFSSGIFTDYHGNRRMEFGLKKMLTLDSLTWSLPIRTINRAIYETLLSVILSKVKYRNCIENLA